jgi:hypothetical protein
LARAAQASGGFDDAEIVAQRNELNAAIALHQEILTKCLDCSERELEKMQNSISLLNERLRLLNDPDPTIALWSKSYPANPDVLVATLLKRFIDVTADVDYKARIKYSHNNILFTNPYYEQKNYLWKFCFHAGKETTDTLRKLAPEWLYEILAMI